MRLEEASPPLTADGFVFVYDIKESDSQKWDSLRLRTGVPQSCSLPLYGLY